MSACTSTHPVYVCFAMSDTREVPAGTALEECKMKDPCHVSSNGKHGVWSDHLHFCKACKTFKPIDACVSRPSGACWPV